VKAEIRAQQQQQQVSVRQQSTLNSQPVAASCPHSLVHSPINQPVMSD